jgi:hypothetical protein
MVLRAALAGIAAVALACSAQATDLVNKDAVTYAIAVTSGAGTMKASIAGKTVKIGVCASTAAKCVVTVEGIGEIEVTGADDVVIQNGRLSKQ